MPRNIIKIDENLCNGCGQCTTGCLEGALQLINGKAKLIRDDLCDGLGACIGTCPTGALTIEQREASAFNEKAVSAHLKQSENVAQWPVQLHLINPLNDFFKNKELVILSTCSPVASRDVHRQYIKGRSVVVACPKLDNVAPYTKKLAELFREAKLLKVIVLRMQVPCCHGLTMITNAARTLARVNDLVIEEHTMGVTGHILTIKEITL
ncbi:MAG: hypothetical protein A2381_07085 [Bdellovibrionales bacterium RIFOXYB1_FULL_37_110]|nr:MAG: hypothetical protein A2417_14960 [Bdellovibrionales bacterium RIFOXYC1_FULL_37_79]OFZ57826.1 MAG: hypothetical protein A2381_07085 [Bdellovibrionales bacterium RIFOXYB1_FULL_37_110]OFZ62792.1 MAG: hypothetical protein A2577_16605 [Bdellovibrionales bacterium RIFOXYD1_FULL_36_51]